MLSLSGLIRSCGLHGRLLGLCLAMLTACSAGATDPPLEQLAGTFALVEYQGLPLPYDVGPLIAPDGHDTGCRLQFTTGYLALRSVDGTFTESIDLRETCQNRLMSQDVAIGGFTQSGTRLDFVLTAPDQVLRYSGVISAGKIDVMFNSITFTYSRP
jgi:hypothetical protein